MDGWVKIGTKLDTKSFDKQIEYVESQLNEIEHKLKQADMGFEVGDTKKLEAEYEKLSQKLSILKTKQENLNKTDLSNIENYIDNIGDSTSNVISKIGKWALAIFAVESAYGFVRRSVSTLSEYNDQIATDVEYINFALASMLQPIIEGIINLVYKLLAYVNYIAQAWFGVNLFANASAKAMDKGAKSAEKMRKTLLGFDEMNVLNENGTTGVLGAMPSYDLSSLENIEIPDWVKWIADNKDLILGAIIEIGKAFLTWKVLQLVSQLGLFADGITNLQKLLQAGGVALLIIGIWNAIGDVINLIADPSWDNFLTLIGDLGIALMGLSAILIGINSSNPLGWITLGIGAIASLISWFGKSTNAMSIEEEQMKRSEQATKDLKDARDRLASVIDSYTDAIKNAEEKNKNLQQVEKETGLSGKELFELIKYGSKNYSELTENQKKTFDAYVMNMEAQDKLKSKTEEFNKVKADEKEAIIDSNVVLAEQGKKYDENFAILIEALRSGKMSLKDFSEYFATILARLDKDSQITFVKGIPSDVLYSLYSFGEFKNSVLGLKNSGALTFKELLKEANITFSSKIPASVNSSIKSFEKFKNSIAKLKNSLFGISNSSVSVDFKTSPRISSGFAKGGVVVTKLAKGGIINNPGKGVPISRAIGGERQTEGVIPLTDSQQMSLLGEAIGRNVVIRTTIINEMDGRVISRNLLEIKNDDDFASNN